MSLSAILRGSSNGAQKGQMRVVKVKKSVANEDPAADGETVASKDGVKTIRGSVTVAPIRVTPVKFSVTELKKITGAAFVPPTLTA